MNSNGSCISNSNINTNKQSVKSYDYNHYEQEFKKATSYNIAIKERIERNNSHNNITFKDSNSSTNNANSKRKRCSSALNGVYSPNHYNYILDKDNKHNSINSSTINNSNSHTLLQKNISNINLIPSSLTNRTNSVSSIRKANPTTNINIPNSHKPPTASYNQPHCYTNSCSNILQSNNTQHRRFNSNSSKVGIVTTITEVGESSETVGIAIGNIAYMAALIAVNLAVMNLLPLPALDGGKVLFLVINALAMLIFRRQIPSKYENYIHFAGLVLLLGLMLVISVSDVYKLFT